MHASLKMHVVRIVFDALVNVRAGWIDVFGIDKPDRVRVIDPALSSLILSTGWGLQEHAFDSLGMLARVEHALEASGGVT